MTKFIKEHPLLFIIMLLFSLGFLAGIVIGIIKYF